MNIPIEPSCDTVNGAISRDNHGKPTNPIVHDTLHNGQPRIDLDYLSEGALTVVPAYFANDEKLCVDAVGKKTHHETEQNSRNRIKNVASILWIDEIRLDPWW